MAVNFKSEEEVQEFITNLGIEYRFGCYKEKKPEVCHLLGDYMEAIKKDFQKASKLYQSTCDNYNYGKSCLKYGNYLAMGKGNEKSDLEKSLKYYEKGCSLGEVNACYRAGVVCMLDSGSKNPTKNYSQGIDYLEKGCNGGNGDSCYHLSGIYMDGVEKAKILKDMTKSYEYALKACNLNNVYACANLSLMYKKGDGVVVDLALSEKYKAKALELQDEYKRRRQITFQEGIAPT